ncbi:MAG: IPT/TIG domain-containing protein [Planctomycetes bacterium]|nr:IPT/TIG domain-containing protein [Planctomycetota bacterium]
MHLRSHAACVLFVLTVTLAATFQIAEGKQLIRITGDNPRAMNAMNLPKDLEIAGYGLRYRDYIVTEPQQQRLRMLGIDFEVRDADMESTLLENRAGYPTFAEIESQLATTAATYSSITNLFTIGQSYQSREIWCLEISDNPGTDEGETELIFLGLHHAREWPSVVVTLHFIDQLTQNYGSDPDITDWVNTRRIFIVPCVNPDGYYYSHDQGNDWRKNRHYLSQFGSWGIDINRNYPGATNGTPEGDWGSIGDGSVTHWSDYETYCGPGGGSELETQAVMNFVMARNPTVLISYHTYSELVIWPWGYDGTAQAPDNALLVSTGQAMANRISGMSGGTYTPQQSAALYPSTGDTTDWAYGELFYVHGKNCLPYTIELCTSFQPTYSLLTQVRNENWDAAEYVLQQADNLRAQMTPFVLPPVPDAPETDSDGNYRVNWTEANPDANAARFQLRELTGLTVITDNIESGTSRWTLDGWSSNTSKSHSATHSLRGANSDATASTATTTYPLPVSPGDTLSFWTWYDLEDDYDFAFPEISLDKRKWIQLDHFNGSSGGWVQKQYSLNAYAGKSIHVRFRYATDSNTLGTGIWVDDITLVPHFSTVTDLGSSILNQYFDITGNTDGDYYYQVRGYSNTRGWGDYSQLDITTVTLGAGPEVLVCTPAEGLMPGGTSVTVTGSGFTTTPDSMVFFDGEAAGNVMVLNSTTLTCNTPASPHPGFVEVSVSNSTGSGSLIDGYEYTPDAGVPRNMTDLDTLNLPQLPVNVVFYTIGDPGRLYLLFFSAGGGPTPTPFGVMGLDLPYYDLLLWTIGAKGYTGLEVTLPDIGPMEFYVHSLVDDSPPVFAEGGNNPNGSGSVKFVLP